MESLEAALLELSVYCRVSDAQINFDKTRISFNGTTLAVPNPWNFEMVTGAYKILGILMGREETL